MIKYFHHDKNGDIDNVIVNFVGHVGDFFFGTVLTGDRSSKCLVKLHYMKFQYSSIQNDDACQVDGAIILKFGWNYKLQIILHAICDDVKSCSYSPQQFRQAIMTTSNCFLYFHISNSYEGITDVGFLKSCSSGDELCVTQEKRNLLCVS